MPDAYGDVANAQLIKSVGKACEVREVSWALHDFNPGVAYAHNSVVSVHEDVGGLPGPALASVTLTPADYVMYPGYTSVDFAPLAVSVQGLYWISIESLSPTEAEGIATLTDFGGGGWNYGAAELWNGFWGLLCLDWNGVPCDIAFVAKSYHCCQPHCCCPCQGDPGWATHQHDQQRTGASFNSFGDAQCDLTTQWCYTHPTNQIFYTGPAISGDKVVCAWDNEVKVFNLTTGFEAYTLSGFPLGNQIRCTPHIQDSVMYLTGGDQQSVSAWDFATGAMIWSRDITSVGVGGLFGQTRYGSFIILEQGSGDVLYFGTDDGAIVAVDAATGALYSGWTVNPVYIAPGAPLKSGSTDGLQLFYNTYPGGVEGDVYAIDAATGAINWQLSTSGGLQAAAVYPEGPQGGEGFAAPNAVSLENGLLFVNSSIAAPYHPGDGVFYAINTSDGSVAYAVPSHRPNTAGTAAGPVIDRARVYQAGQSWWATPPSGGLILAFNKTTGSYVWATSSPEYNTYRGDMALTCGKDGEAPLLFAIGHHGFISTLNSATGEEIYRRRITYGGFPNSIALSAAIGPGVVAISDLYGTLSVLAKGEDRPRLEIQSYQPSPSVEFGPATSLHVPIPNRLVNTGCADLTFGQLETNTSANHPWIPPDFAPANVRPDVMDRAAGITDRLTEGFETKAIPARPEAEVDDYFVIRDRGEQSLNLGADAGVPFLQYATHTEAVVWPHAGDILAAGDTADLVIDVNQSLIVRGPQDFYMVIPSDDPDFYLHDVCGNTLYGPPEIHVTIVGGCLVDTTTMQFGMGGGNTQLVTNNGRIGTGDWDPHAMDIDGDDASIYQGSFIYATGLYEVALSTQDWYSGGGEDEAYRSMQPDPNWCDDQCKAHIDEGVVLSCLGGYSSDGITYTPIMGNRVCVTYLDSVQDFGTSWDWSNYDAPFSNDLTMGLMVNSRTVGAYDFEPLKDLTVDIMEFTERNGDSVTGWAFGTTMDYDVGSDDIASRSAEGSAAWVSNGGVGDVQWGMIKFPFGCGSNEAAGGNNTNVDYVPMINTVSGHGDGMWFNVPTLYLDSAWDYLNRPAGEYSQAPFTSDREAHFTIAKHDFAGGDTYEMAVAQFGLHGTSGDATEINALAKLANKWLGFGRGDVNNDGNVDLGDVVCLARYVTGNGPGPIPFMHLGDVDCDGDVDMDDVVYLAEFLYDNGPCPCGDWCF
ncbi:MAG: PQQ-binding-like beta-propeller repeat protein [candidate division Zixibacteria bacterium]|nr:PQQ-binding-like beta-propeller repeat protein [candidate division Zixibacteria bacterium]